MNLNPCGGCCGAKFFTGMNDPDWTPEKMIAWLAHYEANAVDGRIYFFIHRQDEDCEPKDDTVKLLSDYVEKHNLGSVAIGERRQNYVHEMEPRYHVLRPGSLTPNGNVLKHAKELPEYKELRAAEAQRRRFL